MDELKDQRVKAAKKKMEDVKRKLKEEKQRLIQQARQGF